MTHDEIIAMAKRYQDSLIGDGDELIGFEFSVASVEAFYRAAFNAGIEAAAKHIEGISVAGKHLSYDIRALEMK